MTTRKAILTLSVTCAGFLFIASGCEDQASAQREADAERLHQAGVKYSEVLASANPEQELQGVISELSGTSSQGAALIEAAARSDVAERKLAQAADIESQNRADRFALQGLASAVMELKSIASSHSGFQVAEEATMLDEARADAERSLREAQSQLQSLQQPVSTLTEQNTRDTAEVTRLRAESRKLREQAFELGDLKGIEAFKQAVERDRQADKIEARITQRQIELGDLRSQLAFAEVRVEQLQKRLEAAQSAETELDQTSASFTSSAQQLRTAAGAIEADINNTLKELQATQSQLDSLYADAEAALEAALGKAGTAAGGADAAAKILKVDILQTLGRLQAQKSRGLESHAAVLSRLAETGTVQNASALAQQAQAAADAASNAAADAYTQAAGALDAISGQGIDQRQIAVLKAELQAVATGRSAPQPTMPPVGGSDASNAGGEGSPN